MISDIVVTAKSPPEPKNVNNSMIENENSKHAKDNGKKFEKLAMNAGKSARE